MLITLVALLCSPQGYCLEKIITDTNQSGITFMACQVNAQIGIAEWMANSPYKDWKLKGYRCVTGKYVPRKEA